MTDLTENEQDVIDGLANYERQAEKHGFRYAPWAKPMDIGGGDGSHHSRTLLKLCLAGLVERTSNPTDPKYTWTIDRIKNRKPMKKGERGASKRYRLTDEGKKFARPAPVAVR